MSNISAGSSTHSTLFLDLASSPQWGVGTSDLVNLLPPWTFRTPGIPQKVLICTSRMLLETLQSAVLWYYSSLLQKVLKLAGIDIRIKVLTAQELFSPPLVISLVPQCQILAQPSWLQQKLETYDTRTFGHVVSVRPPARTDSGVGEGRFSKWERESQTCNLGFSCRKMNQFRDTH